MHVEEPDIPLVTTNETSPSLLVMHTYRKESV